MRGAVRPRPSKVFADLWDNKARTLLVVASIAVGVFAIGAIGNAYMVLSEDMDASHAAMSPANIVITTQPFDEEFLTSVKRIEGVTDAEGRQHLTVNVVTDGEPTGNLDLVAKDFSESGINLLQPKDGRSIPEEKEMVLVFDALSDPGYRVGDVLQIELSNGTVRQVPVVGIVMEQGAALDPSQPTRAYVSRDSLEWLGQSPQFGWLLATVSGDSDDEVYIQSVAEAIEDKLERSNYPVIRTVVTESGEHPMSDMLLAILGLFGALGVLVMLLSVSLIFNTLNALLTQDLRQIGVMKLIGARRLQILGMYLALVLLFGIVAALAAVPAGALAGYGLAWFIAYLLNANLQGFRVIPATVLIQLVLSLLVPLAAGFVPVNRGSLTKVRRAISSDPSGGEPSAGRLWHRLSEWFRWLSRPILLSIRNIFRRRGRLLLTLSTLTVAGAVFIAVFNVRASMQNFMDQTAQHSAADLTVRLGRPYRISTIEQAAHQVPGIEVVEAWSGARAEVLDRNGDVVEHLQIVAPPAGSAMIDPKLASGRWLVPGDGNAIVASEAIRDAYPDIEPGDTLRLDVPGAKGEQWTLVGMFSFPDFLGDPLAYVPLSSLSGSRGAPSHAATYRIVTSDQSAAGQARIGDALDQHLRARGFNVNTVQTGAELSEKSVQLIGILVMLLLVMALLTAAVGSIGLTGTMSMNVMERTREIGIMRAIGAVDSAVIRSVVIEGAFIGSISWVIALPLSFPISYLLLNIISTSIGIGNVPLTFALLGMIVWLGLVLGLTALASVWPARNAARLTIREVLAYE